MRHMSSEGMEEKKSKTRVKPVLVSYFTAAKKYPWLLGAVLLGGLIIEITSIIAPLFLGEFIDQLAKLSPTDESLKILFTVLGFFGLSMAVGWVGQRIRMLSLMNIEAKVMADLSNKAFGYLLGHSHDFFISNFAGALTRKVSRYARSFEQVLDSFAFNFYATTLFAIGVIAILSAKNPILGFVLFVWCVFFIWIQFVMTRWRQSLRVLRAEEDSKVTGLLSDAVSNHSTITLFATEKRERTIFGEAVARWRKATNISWNADAWLYGVQGILSIVIELVLLGGALFLWKEGVLSVGDFVLIQIYMIGLIDRIWNMGSSMRKLYDAFADAYEMIEIMEKPHGIQDTEHASTLVGVQGTITFSNVEFGFGENASVLKDLSFTIPDSQKVALVGPSGAGKSTITKLLLRLYDVTGGSVTIDNTNIRSITQESLRNAIAFVPQEPILFHRTLKDNIRYGKQDATDEEVIEASKKAHCHEFISKLPEGYETFVGERGIKLSGGERQRVAIARAILKDAPILVLDEATSSLDSESEHLIQDALATLMEGKTVIIIAHRLSTIMKMDRILVVEGGKIAADGTHDELLTEGGLYHKLWNIQAGGFIAD